MVELDQELDRTNMELREISLSDKKAVNQKLDEMLWLLVFMLVKEPNIKMARQLMSRSVSAIGLINEKAAQGKDFSDLISYFSAIMISYAEFARIRRIKKK